LSSSTPLPLPGLPSWESGWGLLDPGAVVEDGGGFGRGGRYGRRGPGLPVLIRAEFTKLVGEIVI